MAALATPNDVAVDLQRPLTETEVPAVARALDFASGSIRRYTQQTLSEVTDDLAHLWGNWSPKLVLPERPVIDVTSVAINGTVLVADLDYTWRGKQEVLRGDPARVVRQPLDWGGEPSVVTVTYSHGFATIPDEIAGLCIAMVKRYAANPTGIALSGEQLGRYSYTEFRGDIPANAYVLTAADQELLEPYKWCYR